MLPSATKSSTPASVTVCGVFQLATVKVRVDGEIVPSAVLLDDIATLTFAVGCEVRATVNDAVAPASVVVNPDVGVTVNPAVSSSVLVTATSLPFSPL